MLLAVDVGNTNTVLGLYDGDQLVHDFRIETAKGRTTDEYHVLVMSLLTIAGVGRTDVHASILASVVPALNEIFIEAIDRAFDHEMLIVGPGIKTGMPILYENPREVGADRIVNAVAAYERVKGACIIVDFGTATTFDAVSARGEYVGGVIAPGIEISVDALGMRGAQLRKIELARPRSVIGKNTVEAMQSGILYGFAGQVDGVVTRMATELADDPEDVTVIATGGLASMVLGEAMTIDEHEPWLTLIGLRLVYERNVSRA